MSFCGPTCGQAAVLSGVPLPPAERGLESAEATPLFTVGEKGQVLEGAIFDGNAKLYFCNVTECAVMRLSPEKGLERVVELQGMAPGGLAFHRDGRLFIAALNLSEQKGAILAFSFADGKLSAILGPEKGFVPNDLIFDEKGGFYFSDFKGSATEPTGGVYYVDPDFKTVAPVIPHMAQANGVALSPDGTVLWATEFANNRLHRLELNNRVVGSNIAYHFIGPAPDSMRADSEGNVYVAMVGQGRVMIFNRRGLPAGQILLPERDRGRNLFSTSLAIHPRKAELRIVSGNTEDADSKKAAIFSAPAFAPGSTANAK